MRTRLRPAPNRPRCGRPGVTWHAYDRFMRKFVKRIGDETLTRVPRDLDLKPYQDEHDHALLRRMAASLEQGAWAGLSRLSGA